MRNARGLMMIAVALVAGLAAVVLAGRWLSSQTNVMTSKVAVAAVDLSVGQRIGPEQVRMIDWPSGSVPAGAFSDLAQLDGRVAKVTVQRDEPVMESKLAPVGTKGGLSAVISEGKRAITVRVNDVIGVAGFALPGNYVDVLVSTRDERRGDERSVSKIVLERILVLAVAQEAGRDDTKPKVVNAVTLEVTPDEAEKLDLARSVGQLSLVLRNQIDDDPTRTVGATKETLLGRAASPAQAPAVAAPAAPRPAATVVRPVAVQQAAAPAPARRCVDAYIGAERRTECF
jgi:pilus assembly protein CpaB